MLKQSTQKSILGRIRTIKCGTTHLPFVLPYNIDSISACILQFVPDDSTDKSKMRPADGKENHWYHFYIQASGNCPESIAEVGESTNREIYFKISLRGRFDDRGRFFWHTQPQDTPEYRRRELTDRLVKLSQIIRLNPSIRVLIHVNTCDDRKEIAALPEAITPNDISISATVIVFHTYFLANFLTIDDTVDESTYIPKLIQFYNTKFCDLSSTDFVDATLFERETIRDGNRFAVFRKRLHRELETYVPRSREQFWLTEKTYRFKDESASDRTFCLRLSKNGIIEVREEFRFPFNSEGETGTLGDLLLHLLTYRTPDAPLLGGSDQTLIDLVKRFVTHLCQAANDWRLVQIKTDGADSSDDPVKQRMNLLFANRLPEFQLDGIGKAGVYRERQRYTVIVFKQVEYAGGYVSCSLLRASKGLSRSILDATLIYNCDDADAMHLAPVRQMENDGSEIISFSTWENEMCVFGSERCVVYYNPTTVLHADGKVINYADYWRCIIRAIEHSVSVKTLVHLMEKGTIKAIRDVPRIVTLFHERSSTFRFRQRRQDEVVIEQEIDSLTEKTATVLKYLPSVREVAVASSAFRAGHVVDKFHHLYETRFHLSRVLSHIESYINLFTSFLQHFNQLLRESRAKQMAFFFALLALLLAVVAALYSAPSFITSINSMCQSTGTSDIDSLIACFVAPENHYVGTWFLVGLGLFHFAACLVFNFLSLGGARSRVRWVIWASLLCSVFLIGIWCLLPFVAATDLPFDLEVILKIVTSPISRLSTRSLDTVQEVWHPLISLFS